MISNGATAINRAIRLVFDHEKDHPSRWAAVSSIAAKIGCTAQSLNEWVKKAEVDSGVRAGVPAEMAERLKALERENRRLQRECDRQQALVRMAERSLGISAPAVAKPPAKGKEDLKNGGPKRRQRRPSVRALQVVRDLRSEDGPEAPESGVAESAAEVSS